MSVKHVFNEFDRLISVYNLSKTEIMKLKFKILFFGQKVR